MTLKIIEKTYGRNNTQIDKVQNKQNTEEQKDRGWNRLTRRRDRQKKERNRQLDTGWNRHKDRTDVHRIKHTERQTQDKTYRIT